MEYLSQWQKTVHQIKDVCSEFDSRWLKRRRVFDTFSLVSVLLDLCVGNNKSYFQVLCRAQIKPSCSPAPSSLCVARSKLPAEILSEIRSRLLEHWSDQDSRQTWFGFSPHVIDGSRINVPRSLWDQGFPRHNIAHTPHGLLSTLLRVSDKMVIDQIFTSKLNERASAVELIKELSSKDLVIYDRGYFSFGLLHHHNYLGIPALFRLPRGPTDVCIDLAWNNSFEDQIIELSPSKPTLTKAQNDFGDDLSDCVKLRLIKYRLNGEEYMLGTTIFDQSITPKDFAELYGKRWKIEEFLKNFKCYQEVEEFHSKSINGIQQELGAGTLLWNLAQYLERISAPFKKTFWLFKDIPLPNELSTNRFMDKSQRPRTFPSYL